MSKSNHANVVVEKDENSPLLVKTKEACRMLGSIHPRTLARLESRGLIRPVTGLWRHKVYAVEDLRSLVAQLKDWNP